MKVIVIPHSFDNYAYLIICEKSGEAAVVDPGEFYPVNSELKKHEIRLGAVYCTHHHGDHIGGLAELRKEYDGIRVYGSAEDVGRIPGMNCLLTEESEICIGETAGRVITTPGHTRGSICYSFNEHLFTGDTLFGGGCGRLFEGSPKEMYESLNVKLKEFGMDTKIWFGHEYTTQNLKFAKFVEPDNSAVDKRLAEIEKIQRGLLISTPSSMQLECETNPFLRCGEEGVVKTVAERSSIDSLDPLVVFTAVRKMKDNF
jgi:hydroxyacylglutathione hydrolase